jgi:hypothetical protein
VQVNNNGIAVTGISGANANVGDATKDFLQAVLITDPQNYGAA